MVPPRYHSLDIVKPEVLQTDEMDNTGKDRQTNINSDFNRFPQRMVLKKLTHAVGYGHSQSNGYLIESAKNTTGETGGHRQDPGRDQTSSYCAVNSH